MTSLGLRLALIYNLKPPPPAGGRVADDRVSEFDSVSTIDALRQAIEWLGHEVRAVEASGDLSTWLTRRRVDLAFNLAECLPWGGGPLTPLQRRYRESQVPALLEALGIPFTGSSAATLAVALDKARTKRLVERAGMATPRSQLFVTGEESLAAHLRFPLIVKPNREGSGIGIHAASVVHRAREVRARVRQVLAAHQQEALVEEFIDGQEVTVGVLEDPAPQALPPLEADFSPCVNGERFYTWQVKEYQGQPHRGLTPRFFCPARLDGATQATVQGIALRAHRLLGCRDYSRTDLRIGRDGIPYVLEVNPLPGLDPQESCLTLMARQAGRSYDALIGAIVASACRRLRPPRVGGAPAPDPVGAMAMAAAGGAEAV